jgi:outer membrane murein-binding lipoprotein Lpp
MYGPKKTNRSWPGLAIRFSVSTSFLPLLVFAGCLSTAKVRIVSSAEPNKPGQVIELQGDAAEKYSARITEVSAANMQTAKGRQNEMIAELKKVLPWLGITIVAGLVFWGYTRSRYGWVIPGAAVAGIIFILTVGRWAEWITAGVIVIALGLLVWKCIEYQLERNQNGSRAATVKTA